MTLFLAATFKQVLWDLVRRFGAFVFFPLGLLDMSVIPAPGSFDVLLIVLTAGHSEHWWYYALMATAGSVVGAWPSFQLGRKGGEEAIEKRLGPRRSKRVFAAFQRWGFWSLFIGAISPPPMPASAFVLTAGALNYPATSFVLSWTLGRLLRFGVLAWITMRYGGQLFQWLRPYYRPALWTVAAAVVAATISALWFYLRERRRISPLAAESAQSQIDQFESYLERADADTYTSSAETHNGVSTKKTAVRGGPSRKNVSTPKATNHESRSAKKASHHQGSSAESAGKYIGSPGKKSTPADTEKSNGKLNINSATKEELLQLYGVGEATAAKIIASRPYKNKRELLTRKLVSQSVYHAISERLVARNHRDHRDNVA